MVDLVLLEPLEQLDWELQDLLELLDLVVQQVRLDLMGQQAQLDYRGPPVPPG
jgi:hypothetical protein